MPKTYTGVRLDGAAVLAERTRQGLGAGELADRAGVHRNTLWCIERDQWRPSPGMIALIAGALRVDPDTLTTTAPIVAAAGHGNVVPIQRGRRRR